MLGAVCFVGSYDYAITSDAFMVSVFFVPWVSGRIVAPLSLIFRKVSRLFSILVIFRGFWFFLAFASLLAVVLEVVFLKVVVLIVVIVSASGMMLLRLMLILLPRFYMTITWFTWVFSVPGFIFVFVAWFSFMGLRSLTPLDAVVNGFLRVKFSFSDLVITARGRPAGFCHYFGRDGKTQ